MDTLTRLPAGLQMTRGRPWPMGAHHDGEAVNFAVFSAHANRVELCLYDDTGTHEVARIALPGLDQDVWHGRVVGLAPGAVYGFRAHGPWRPERGHRFNPHKLLLDPCAREIVGSFEWRPEHSGADTVHPGHQDMRDNGTHALKARVVHERVDWHGDRHPHQPREDVVLYEMHVKGFSRLNPAVPEALRGTYAGLAHEASIAHLKRLGVTAVSLLPVHQHLDEQHAVKLGLVNYWGYNTLGFFCPEPRLAAARGGAAVREEFRAMVRALHREGIEVILDVVYNHTCESDEHGPTIAWRGLDNASWYRLPHEQMQRYVNDAGCGNTLDMRHPRVLQFVMDSLRFWVQEMHVDGFRFDLAPVLGRGDHGFDRHAAFFKAVAQDPALAGTRLIAEPWDIGLGGYQLGGFPRGWLEWNDRFRDTMRGWWLRGLGTRGEFAQRLCASSDIFHKMHRLPAESVNFIVAHDGFTLRDLVSHVHRHNEANGEGNRDGHGHNLGCNFGVEGETDDVAVLALRARAQRALLATLLLSQGTPMLAAGDELGHTQSGNNNPYCQDNAITWIDWAKADEPLIDFTARLLALRRAHQPLAACWYTGVADSRGLPDLAWLRSDGRSLEGDDWQRADGRCLGALIGAPGRRAADGGDALLLLVNAGADAHDFTLPPGRWRILFDSSAADGRPADDTDHSGVLHLGERCVQLLAGTELLRHPNLLAKKPAP
jgi:glycogen debranching enzyme